MRIAVACLVTLLPVLAFASVVDPKDKYLNCNCHITPSIGPAPAAHSAAPAKHKHKSVAKKAPTTAPVKHAAVKHKHKPVVAAVKKTSPALGDQGYPGRDAIVSSNKLPLPAGKSMYSPGQLVYISGRVLDMKCVPVSDAIVEIWQTNPEGQYVKSTLGERLSPGPHFTGSGRATTDNLGRFNFVTVLPGTIGARAPFIHVHVAHKDFPTLNTEMFFGGDEHNGTDPVLVGLNATQQEKVTAKVWQRDVNDPEKGLAATWDISLNGKNPYRHF